MVDFSELNEAQQLAVKCIDAPSLVIAGAGSGKTRVLTYKIAYLLEQNFAPWSILALTFTNKAAREMQQRISKQVGDDLARNLWMGTFHSIFSRILRIECDKLGFSSNFTIYDATDQKSLVKTIIKEMGLDDKVYKPSTIVNRISDAKNRLVFPDTYMNSKTAAEHDHAANIPMTGKIYLKYMQRCKLSDAMDFDDLLLYTFYLFDRFPDVLKKYEERFQYVLVDEYQDTNYAQHRIVWQLTQHRQRVCVVGDDAQSIYSFRGANIDNILHFQEMYQGAKLFKLERNYRSTQNIVNAANTLIGHNRGQIKKDVYSEKAEGAPIRLFKVHSDFEESIVVSKKIANLHDHEHIPYGDIAILYRTNSQSRSLEESLRKDGHPYRIYGGLSFYQRKEIKDVIAYLRLTVNPHDEEALRRIINYPARGIGETTVGKVMENAVYHGVSPWEVLDKPSEFGLEVNKGTLTKLGNFVEMMRSFCVLADNTDAYNLARKIVLESGVSADINKGREADDISRQENLQELLDGMAAFVEERQEQGAPCQLRDYLQEVSLLSDLDDDQNESECEDTQGKVTLMTVHSAKGLEFRIVFVVGLEEELFPNQMALQEGSKGLEEERRLMYVAMTRAEEQLFLTTAQTRFRFGKTETSSPSRFLREIDSRYLSTGGASQPKQDMSRGLFGSSLNSDSTRGLFGSSSNTTSARTNFGTSSQTEASKYPPSVWGKTLKRVSSLPKSTPTAQPSSFGRSGVSSPSLGGARITPPTQTSDSQASASSAELHVGSVIEHSRFGVGKVTQLEGTGMDTKATVDFVNVGTKQLLLRFAKFKVVS